jgi:hypothetical protein
MFRTINPTPNPLMKSLRLLACAAALGALSSVASASIVISITARQLSADDIGSVPLAAGTLIQLVNIGDDGFNQIDLSDGNVSQFGQWVSGNDSLITALFVGATAEDPDFSAAAFDLAPGADSIAGRLGRVFEFELGAIPVGAKLGIRWFPGLLATDFNTITLATGQKYGQFTRQTNPLYDRELWIAPSDGSTVTFDNLKTVNQLDGQDPMSAGAATFSVVPEPAAIGMSLLGAAGLAMLRRRRA